MTNRARIHCHVLLATLAFAATLATSAARSADPPKSRPIAVSYTSASAIYLDSGRAEGVAVGARARVLRGGEEIAELEVSYVAEHSSSCRIVNQKSEVRPGDAIQLLTAPLAASQAAPVPTPATVTRPEPASEPAAAPAPNAPLPPAIGKFPGTRQQTAPWARVTGSVSTGGQQFKDTTSSGGNYSEGTGRLSLQARGIQGMPLDLRMRARTLSSTTGSGVTSRSASSQRLYELSLSYAPKEGRLAVLAGRIGATPYISMGYLDGILGQYRLSRRLFTGAFYGKRPELVNLDLRTAGEKYGAFLRYATPSDDYSHYGEVVLAGVGEYQKGQIDREYLSLESRFGAGSAWSLFEHAEVDFNRAWRLERSGKSYQLSNVTISGSYLLTDWARASLSYDRRRNYLTFEDRIRPEDLFNDLLRDGASATLYLGKSQGINATLNFGARRQTNSLAVGGSESTRTWGASVFHNNVGGWNLLLGADVSVYTGGTAEGHLATVRIRKYIHGGHDLGLTFGESSIRVPGTSGTRVNRWARLSSDIELPWRMYLLAEYEYDTGADLKGNRVILEVGYRF